MDTHMEIKFYRDKIQNVFFLEFDHVWKRQPRVTTNVADAIRTYMDVKTFIENPVNKDDTYQYTEAKQYSIDGFTGTLTKTITLENEDFEEVTFVEKQK